MTSSTNERVAAAIRPSESVFRPREAGYFKTENL